VEIKTSIPLLEEILDEYREYLGKDLLPYKNHLYRIVNFCLQLKPEIDNYQEQKVVIAACFHDLAIWTDDTLDYLQPSIDLAKKYLVEQGLEQWSPEVELMIDLHHRIRKYEENNYPLVELFRQADLIDVSLGMVKFGLSSDSVKNIRSTFPNHGFHKKLGQLFVRELGRNPLNPMPMMKW
jgi:hypothetical protein